MIVPVFSTLPPSAPTMPSSPAVMVPPLTTKTPFADTTPSSPAVTEPVLLSEALSAPRTASSPATICPLLSTAGSAERSPTIALPDVRMRPEFTTSIVSSVAPIPPSSVPVFVTSSPWLAKTPPSMRPSLRTFVKDGPDETPPRITPDDRFRTVASSSAWIPPSISPALSSVTLNLEAMAARPPAIVPSAALRTVTNSSPSMP